MLIVGLTGGIASGKSFVVKYLKKIKIPSHDSDGVIDLLYKKPSKLFLDYLEKNNFREAISGGKINKGLIKSDIFNSDEKRKTIEFFLHKYVGKERKKFIEKNKSKKIIFLDIPLLFEKKLQKECDYVCSTIAPLRIRKRRALQRRGMNKRLFNLIVKTQVKNKERRLKSDFIINTQGDRKKTYLQVENMIYYLFNKKKK
jgi:dephospho-CoA kinase